MPEPTCGCGCGGVPSPGRRYLFGHSFKNRGPMPPEQRAKIAAAQRKRLAARRRAKLLAGTTGSYDLAAQQSRARKAERIAEAHRLAADGHDVAQIASAVGVSPTSVERYLAVDLAAVEEDARGPVVISRCARCSWSVELPVRDAGEAFKAHDCVAAVAA